MNADSAKKSFTPWKAGILNVLSIALAGFFTLMFFHVGNDASFDISFIGTGMKIAAVVTPLFVILCMYLSQKKRSYGWGWLGLLSPLLIFMLTFFVAGTIDALVMTGS